MLHMAVDRSNNTRVFPGTLELAVNKSFVPLNAADYKEELFSKPTGLSDEEIAHNGETYFPLDHAGDAPSHVTSGPGASAKDYFSRASVAKAMAYYSSDYEL